MTDPLRRAWLPLLMLCGGLLRGSAAEPGDEFFENRIRPVLVEHCLECHSASAKVRGGLSLDSRAALLRGGDSGPAVVPGHPENSLLLHAVEHRNPDLAMPAKRPQLPPALREDLARWVREGAPWPGGTPEATPAPAGFDLAGRKARLPWIWTSPRRHPVPGPPAPSGARPNPSAEVDRFLLARLDEKGLVPAPPTDDRTWLRRVYFVITGLPPAPEAVRAFAEDPSPDKRERVVEGLLASPHYGERWARHWMDLVRYAESRGHESDFPIPNAWHYRDYLVRAFNDDLPYDRFVAEHVAGDLLPPRTRAGSGANEAVLATGWAFLGEEVHSPVDIRQDECERVDNKVDVLTKTFLGLTVACARCHDHKFDAVTQRDYYALSGFVLSSGYRQVRFETDAADRALAVDLATLRARHRPVVAQALAAEVQPGLGVVAASLEAAGQVVRGDAPETVAARTGIPVERLAAWAAELQDAHGRPGHFLHAYALLARRVDVAGLSGESFQTRAGELWPRTPEPPAAAAVRADFTVPDRTPWKVDGPVFGTRPAAAGELVLGAGTNTAGLRVMPVGAARRDRFWDRLALAPGTESESGSLNAPARAGRMVRTPTFVLESGKVHTLLRGKARVYAAVDSHIMIAGPLHGSLMATLDGRPGGSWVTQDLSAYTGHRTHLEFVPEGDGDLEILMVVEAPEAPAFQPGLPSRPSVLPESLRALAASLQSDLAAAASALGRDALQDSPNLAPAAEWLVARRTLLAPAPGSGTGTGARPAPGGVEAALADFRRAQDALAGRVTWTSRTAVAWFDGTGVDERILVRGKPSRPADVAPRALPEAFGTPPIREGSTSGRAALAAQLTDPGNPLVARVMVNRVWQHVFGRGIVATPDNFGYLGERPTHPELLDHLAWGFIHEDGWSVKRLLRKLVLTEAFARSSRAATGREAEVDPGNTLLHRMPVRRLESEAIRDAVLAVSGRLDPKLGGPPVPVHLTEFIIGRGRPERSGPLDGDGRRSLYTAVPRNFLPTMMVSFDYPTPFSTVGRRNTTNVPGQPLSLMNDPFVHDQARFWAARVFRTLPGAADEARLRWMFETAYARPPGDSEVGACLAALEDLRSLHPAGRELDVWSDLAHALYNANEFIYLN